MTKLLVRLQLPLALLCVAALAFLQLDHGLDVPSWLDPALLVLAASLGVPRPSEKAKALLE